MGNHLISTWVQQKLLCHHITPARKLALAILPLVQVHLSDPDDFSSFMLVLSSVDLHVTQTNLLIIPTHATHILLHLILTATLGGRYYYLHFKDGGMETQGG